MTLYRYEDVQKELNNRITETRELIAAYQKVNFITKKDGSHFASIKRNIENARYHQATYGATAGEYYLSVTSCINYHYIEDQIHCYCLVKDLTDAEMIAKKQNYQPIQNTWSYQVYTYDIEDIKKAVADNIELLKNRLAIYEKQSTISETAFNKYQEAIRKARKELKDATLYDSNRGLYYDITETVEKGL